MKSRTRSLLRTLAAAAAALSAGTAAQAQSTAQVYGLVDVSAMSYKESGGRRVQQVASGRMATSYLGFRATEDLGGGLQALVTLEHFFRADTGEAGRFAGDSFWSRNANVGLRGDFGMVRLGRIGTPLFINTLSFNPFSDSFGFSPSIRTIYQGGIGKLSGDSGWNNAIGYSSPKFGGFSGSLLVAAGEGAGGPNVGGSLQYASGPLAIGFAAQKVEAAFADGDETAWQLGASYDFGAAKLFGQVGRIKEGDTRVASGAIAAGNDTRDRTLQFGASVPVTTAGSILASYGEAKTTGRLDTKRSFTTVAYDHRLSKRTDVYAVVMFDKLKGQDRAATTAVGLRHTF
ncbi:porin [Aquincola sp. MAHUQ-54]|uniref:Porin n=1 Tax=Aquincola agrisoli TaxID=3119538 RepID=A0AAW9QJV6_9BURK